MVVFYPADWDPECQAILSAFSALSDQFSSCHVSTVTGVEKFQEQKKYEGKFLLEKNVEFSRPLSLVAPLTA